MSTETETQVYRDLFTDSEILEIDANGDKKGRILARVGNVGEINRNRRQLMSGVFGSGKSRVVVSDFNHNSVRGTDLFSSPSVKPVAHGQLWEEDGKFMLEAFYPVHMDAGVKAFDYLDFMRPAMHWSIGYIVSKYEAKRDGRQRSYLEVSRANAIEASPTTLPAASGTRTINADEEGDEDEPSLEAFDTDDLLVELRRRGLKLVDPAPYVEYFNGRLPKGEESE